MSDCLEVCGHCRRSFMVRFRDFTDVGFYFHWVDDYFLIDVVMFLEGFRSKMHVLYSRVYVIE